MYNSYIYIFTFTLYIFIIQHNDTLPKYGHKALDRLHFANLARQYFAGFLFLRLQ